MLALDCSQDRTLDRLISNVRTGIDSKIRIGAGRPSFKLTPFILSEVLSARDVIVGNSSLSGLSSNCSLRSSMLQSRVEAIGLLGLMKMQESGERAVNLRPVPATSLRRQYGVGIFIQ